MLDILEPQLGRDAVIVMAAAIGAVTIINLIPSLSDPFGLLYVMIHELGHVFASWLTGGEGIGFKVTSPDSGYTTFTKIGNDYLVTPAGYLGTTLFSAVLVLLTGWPLIARYALIVLGGLLIVAVMRYGDPTSMLTVLTGLGFGLLLIWVGWQAELVWTVFLLYFLAVQGALTALYHIGELAVAVSREPPSVGDDASIMSQLLGCAPGCWVISWFILSVAMLAAAFWFVWLRPLQT